MQESDKLELVVISDPYPTHLAVMSDRRNGVYLLPTCTSTGGTNGRSAPFV